MTHEHAENEQCAVCAAGGNLDVFFQKVAADIAGPHKLSIVGVMDNPPFAYTVGLSTTSVGAEIVIIGLRPERAAVILNDIADAVRDGKTIQTDVPDARWANMPCVFKRATAPETFEKYAPMPARFYGLPVNVLQMVLPDMAGKFPWEKGYAAGYMDKRQPRLFAEAAA